MIYSKWEEKENIIGGLTKLDNKVSSIPIIKNEKGVYGLNKDSHNMIIGSDYKENAECILKPFIKSMVSSGHSFVINDISNIYEFIKEDLKDYSKIVIDLSNTKESNSFNPLYVPYVLYKKNKDKALKALEEVGYYLLNDGKIESDPFWENTAIDYFCGLTMYLFETKGLVSVKDVFNLSTDILEKADKDSFMSNIDTKSDIYAYLVGTMNTAPETYQSILSVFHQKIKKYVVGDALELLSNNDIKLDDIVDKKFAVFIKGVDKYASHIMPLIVSEINYLCEISKKNNRIEVVLDDFDSLIPIRDFTRLLKYSVVTDIRYTIILSGYKSVINKYGVEKYGLLELCFQNVVYLLSNDVSTLKKISEYCGNINKDGKDMPLISVNELKTFKNGDALVLIPRYYPFKTNLL